MNSLSTAIMPLLVDRFVIVPVHANTDAVHRFTRNNHGFASGGGPAGPSPAVLCLRSCKAVYELLY